MMMTSESYDDEREENVSPDESLTTMTAMTTMSTTSGSIVSATNTQIAALDLKRKKERKQMKMGSLIFIAVYAIAYLSLTSNPPLEVHKPDDSLFWSQNKTLMGELKKKHLLQLASAITRSFEPVSPNVWCIDGRLKQDQAKRRPMGLCYVNLPRAASGTLSSINVRISRNFAQRQNFKTCIRHDGPISPMYAYSKRDKLSFLWTFLRNPKDRAMSRAAQAWTKIRRKGSENSTFYASPQEYTRFVLATLKSSTTNSRNGVLSEGRGGFQLQYTMLHMIEEYSAWTEQYPARILRPELIQQNIRQTLNAYDFIGLVERFDESLVALQFILGLETNDILYFASRQHHQYQARPARGKRHIFYCAKSIDPKLLLTPPVQAYLDGPQWWAQNYGDYLFYEAVSLSLDRTILSIGLKEFSVALKQFRKLRQQALETCHPLYPCSTIEGIYDPTHSKEDCYFDDVGCGYRCLDNLPFPNSNMTTSRRFL